MSEHPAPQPQQLSLPLPRASAVRVAEPERQRVVLLLAQLLLSVAGATGHWAHDAPEAAREPR